MTGEILTFTKSPHQQVLELLPWFLTGVLDEDEHWMVEQHILSCAECRAEVVSQRVLQEAVGCEEPTPGAQEALVKLLPRLDTPGPPRTKQGQHLGGWVLGAVLRLPVWARLTLTLQFGVVVALALTVHRADEDSPTYHALASATRPISTDGNLVVVFLPQTRLRDMQNILINSGARIVDGPLASGGYVLHAPPASLRATVAWLRTQRAVELAERLDAQGAR